MSGLSERDVERLTALILKGLRREDYSAQTVAEGVTRTVVASDWLAERDAAIRDEALAPIRALAKKWRCNCGGPSPEGHHEMHCDSYYGDSLRAALVGGDQS